jgi:hypothetical protein
VDLNCLLLTRDYALLSAVRSNSSRLGIKVLWDKHAPAAVKFAARHHLDGFIIDCDDPQGREALANIKKNPANRFSATLVIVNSKTPPAVAADLGAGFVLGKPVEDGRLRASLDRHYVTGYQYILGYGFSSADRCSPCANVPDRGPERLAGVEFNLPNAKAHRFTGKAILVWAKQDVAGLRFLYIEPECRMGFQAWLELLALPKMVWEHRRYFRYEAQQQFRALQRKLRPSDLTELT